MKTATCVFDILNDSPDELLLYLEPEGNEFRLPPGKAVQIRLYGSEHPIEMKHSSDTSGRSTVSFWPASGDFELFFEGKSVWEQL
jgi:hypothetical protein